MVTAVREFSGRDGGRQARREARDNHPLCVRVRVKNGPTIELEYGLASQRVNVFTRSRILAALVAALLALGLVFPDLAMAKASGHGIENLRKYAGIVVDAKTGQTLYQENA